MHGARVHGHFSKRAKRSNWWAEAAAGTRRGEGGAVGGVEPSRRAGTAGSFELLCLVSEFNLLEIRTGKLVLFGLGKVWLLSLVRSSVLVAAVICQKSWIIEMESQSDSWSDDIKSPEEFENEMGSHEEFDIELAQKYEVSPSVFLSDNLSCFYNLFFQLTRILSVSKSFPPPSFLDRTIERRAEKCKVVSKSFVVALYDVQRSVKKNSKWLQGLGTHVT